MDSPSHSNRVHVRVSQLRFLFLRQLFNCVLSSHKLKIKISYRAKYRHFLVEEDGTLVLMRSSNEPTTILHDHVDLPTFDNYNSLLNKISQLLSRLPIAPEYFNNIFCEILSQVVELGPNIWNQALPLHIKVVICQDLINNFDDYLTYDVVRESLAEPESTNQRMVRATESSIKTMLKMLKMGVNEESKSCSICLEELQVESRVMRMPCLHEFHGDCIISWLKQSHRCPICRFQMPTA